MPAKGSFRDLTGIKFGYLTVLGLGKTKGYVRWWRCSCRCGKTLEVLTDSLRGGNTKSCGCFKKEWMERYKKNRLMTHGMSRRDEYRIWWDMKRRCENPKNTAYKNYGGRGITICERWQEFEMFFADMGERPSSKHTIDRINNDGNYEPGNCRWATRKQQARNNRRTLFVDVDGVRMALIDYILGSEIRYRTAVGRYHRGFSPTEILLGRSKPVTSIQNKS